MNQALRCFPHMVSVLRSGSWRPRGKPGPGWGGESLSGCSSTALGSGVAGRCVAALSDLQHVPSWVTFSPFHVAAQSPAMGSAEAVAPRRLPGGGVLVEGSAQSRPLGLEFHRGSVVSPDSASQNLSRDPLLVLPPCPLPATPQPLRVFFSEPTLFWAGGWGTQMSQEPQRGAPFLASCTSHRACR